MMTAVSNRVVTRNMIMISSRLRQFLRREEHGDGGGDVYAQRFPRRGQHDDGGGGSDDGHGQ
jgi:hypothetical protein